MTVDSDYNANMASLSHDQQIEIAMAIHIGTLADALIKLGVLEKDWYQQAMAQTAASFRDSASGRVASYIHDAFDLGFSQKRPFEIIVGGLAGSEPKSE